MCCTSNLVGPKAHNTTHVNNIYIYIYIFATNQRGGEIVVYMTYKESRDITHHHELNFPSPKSPPGVIYKLLINIFKFS